jgi:hypothetical protein
VAAFAQHHLLAAELHFGLALVVTNVPFERMIDDDELVAPDARSGVLAGRERPRSRTSFCASRPWDTAVAAGPMSISRCAVQQL